jgi:Cu+-exporting ATPase
MSSDDPAAVAQPIDPVCGMTVDPKDAAGAHEYRGTTYYFCNPHCLERFRTAPNDFVPNDGDPKTAFAAVPGARSYICPMDPEVRQREPGACPTCGMAI